MIAYEFICHMNSYLSKVQLTFDSTAPGLGAFQILNRNITSSLRPLPAMLRVLVELSDHVIAFYNELITLMNAAGPSWQLIRKERDVLIRIRGGEAVSHIRRDHPQC
jgi:hypothetical protein